MITPAPTVILWLDEIGPEHRSVVGGKALALALLKKHGFSVPDGFVVTTPAWSNSGDLDSIAGSEVLAAAAQLGCPRLAVRSSSLQEDSARFSYAGQFQSLLGVRQPDLLEAIAQCRSSAFNPTLEAYARQEGGAPGLLSESLAILVQREIIPELSGVAFTANPVTGNPLEVILEYQRGRACGVTVGTATPERAVFKRREGRLSHLAKDNAESQELDQVIILSLKVESLFGCPQDIEWVASEGKIYIVQSRPITSLAAEPDLQALVEEELGKLKRQAAKRATAWGHIFAEMLPQPLPISEHLVQLTNRRNAAIGQTHRYFGLDYNDQCQGEELYVSFCGRFFINLAAGVESVKNLPLELDYDALKKDPSLALELSPPIRWLHCSPLQLVKVLASLANIVMKFLRAERRFHRDYRDTLQPAYNRWLKAEQACDLSLLTDEQALRRVQRLVEHLASEPFTHHQISDFLSVSIFSILKKGLRLLRIDRSDALLVRSLKARAGNINHETSLDISKVVREEWKIENFLNRHGHRAQIDLELACPRWREVPGLIEQLVNIYRTNAKATLEQVLQAEAEDSRLAEQELLDVVSRKHPIFGALIRGFVRAQLYYGRIYSSMRETTHFHLCREIELIRQCLIELGKRSRLGEKIFYLQVDELGLVFEDPARAVAVSEWRKSSLEQLLKVEVSNVIFSDSLGEAIKDKKPQAGPILIGVAASGGSYSGPARVILGEKDFPRLRGGDVLVTCSPNPTWTPLFMVARAVVSETGGVLSHSVIVARELGLPTVVGVDGATRLIRDGDILRVEGGTGRVYLLS